MARTGSPLQARRDQTPIGFQRDLLQSFLEGEGAECGYVLFGLAGMVLAPNALRRIALGLFGS